MRHRHISGFLATVGLALVTFIGCAQAQNSAAATPRRSESQSKLKAGANSFVESQVRDLLEQKGYSNVSSLMNDKNGIWHGKAVRNRTTFDVSVDYQGHIAAK